MARGQNQSTGRTARSEAILRSLGGGSDEIAAYRSARRIDKAYIAATKELRSLIKDGRVYIVEELTNFIESKNAELNRVNSQDGNFYKEVARITGEIKAKVAKTRAEFGTLGDLSMAMQYPRQDIGTLRRYYEDTNIHMAYVKSPGDSKASAGKQVFFIGDQLRKGDTFTFTDKDGNKGKVESVGEARLLKEATSLEAGMDLGTPVYILDDRYYERGKA